MKGELPKIISLRKELKRLSGDEQDLPVRTFFCLLYEFYNDPSLQRLLTTVIRRRPNITEEHLSYLLFVSLQYVTDFSYDDISEENKDSYKAKLKNDVAAYSQLLEELCTTRNISTNLVGRYAALQIILSMLNREELVIADIGCSVGLGLMALNTDSFQYIDIRDSGLQQSLKRKVDIANAIGIDIQTPDLKWQLACYLPESRRVRENFQNMWDNLKKYGQRFHFIQGDALYLQNIPQLCLHSVDVVWISNTCYQIEGDITKVEKAIQWLLKSDGIWLYAYYRHPDWKFASKRNPYVVTLRKNNSWDQKIEILKSPSDCVESITRGKHFEKFQRGLRR